MENKFTDGPWQISGNTIIGNVDGGYGDDGSQTRHDTICTMEDEYCCQLENWKYNALLIEQAPKLLEALENILGLIDSGYLIRDTSKDSDPSWAVKQLRPVMLLGNAVQIIKKAKGL